MNDAAGIKLRCNNCGHSFWTQDALWILGTDETIGLEVQPRGRTFTDEERAQRRVPDGHDVEGYYQDCPHCGDVAFDCDESERLFADIPRQWAKASRLREVEEFDNSLSTTPIDSEGVSSSVEMSCSCCNNKFTSLRPLRILESNGSLTTDYLPVGEPYEDPVPGEQLEKKEEKIEKEHVVGHFDDCWRCGHLAFDRKELWNLYKSEIDGTGRTTLEYWDCGQIKDINDWGPSTEARWRGYYSRRSMCGYICEIRHLLKSKDLFWVICCGNFVGATAVWLFQGSGLAWAASILIAYLTFRLVRGIYPMQYHSRPGP